MSQTVTMQTSHTGHFGFSGVQSHSAGPIFPWTIVVEGIDSGVVYAICGSFADKTTEFSYSTPEQFDVAYAAAYSEANARKLYRELNGRNEDWKPEYVSDSADSFDDNEAFYYDAPKASRTFVTVAPEFAAKPVDLLPEVLADVAHAELQTNRGFSLNSFGQSPTAGYMVSLPDKERQIPLATIEEWQGLLAVLICEAPLHLARASAAGSTFGGLYWGGWIDGPILYLDLSVNITTRERAEFLGAKWNQLAIWDVVNKTSIRLAD